MEIRRRIENGFLFFDGAMGTKLQKAGLKAGELPEIYNLRNPEAVKEIHKQYLKAGAEVLTTNTFGASEGKLKNSGYSVEEVVEAAVACAKEAIQEMGEEGKKYVALDIGPIGQLMEPMGTLKFEEAYAFFKRQILAGVKKGCDMILIETMSDGYEAKAAILAAKENSTLPVFCTMTFGRDGRTLTGADPLTMVTLLEGLGVDALGVNCSLGPLEMLPIIEQIVKYASIPVMVQPNAGLPRVEKNTTVYDIGPAEFAAYAKDIAAKGVAVLGGCCGTTEEYIKEMIEAVKEQPFVKRQGLMQTVVCSGMRTVRLEEGPIVIGERINPTGKKKLKDALLSNNLDYILEEAIDQKEAGAEVLDVNVGLPEIDEKEKMVEVIRAVQSVVALPLQIDSSSPEVIERAMRIYNGKPIVNSVNGKESNMEAIFPIVKKYGGCVIGLTLDEKGIPSSVEERVAIAEKIISTAEKYGIHRKDIIIDCLVLTASAQQKDVMDTLKAVTKVKEKFGVKTVLGVSNVSFGLPQRELLNRTYLAMALMAGLDAPILNPMAKEMMETVASFKVLANKDQEAKEYIYHYGNIEKKAATVKPVERDLKQIILDGLKEEAGPKTKELLQHIPGLTIVDEYIIPALNIVGGRYEKGEMFLPQLIQSAETVQNAFVVIREEMKAKGQSKETKGRIILATVKGDIHDIGKNIVKVLLQNYGFEVLDLGKDVPIEKVVETAQREKIELIGLSALMTTTVKSMEETIAALREKGVSCQVFVGGAVLNQQYADQIGADHYAKDAMESVKIAQQYFK